MLGYDAVLLGQYFPDVSNGCNALILKGLVVQVESLDCSSLEGEGTMFVPDAENY